MGYWCLRESERDWFIGENGEKCLKPNKQFLNLWTTNLSEVEKDAFHVT